MRNSGQGQPGKRRRRRIGLLVLLVAGGFYYLDGGSINRPGEALQKITEALGEFAARPEAAWRRAAAALEKIGANREGLPAPDFDLTGRVVRIADGDTVSILDESNTQHKVRLFGIDTPERDQPFGNAAKKNLQELIGQGAVGVVVVTTDSYGRKVGTLYHDGVNINAAMVASGYAWWYRHFAPHERKLAVSEQLAREQRLGLWSAPHPIPPWDWRRGQR